MAPSLLSIHQLGTQGGWASRLDGGLCLCIVLIFVASRLSGGLYEIYEYIEYLYILKTGWRSIALRCKNILGGGL